MLSETKLRASYEKQKKIFEDAKERKISNLEKHLQILQDKATELNEQIRQIEKQVQKERERSFRSFQSFQDLQIAQANSAIDQAAEPESSGSAD